MTFIDEARQYLDQIEVSWEFSPRSGNVWNSMELADVNCVITNPTPVEFREVRAVIRVSGPAEITNVPFGYMDKEPGEDEWKIAKFNKPIQEMKPGRTVRLPLTLESSGAGTMAFTLEIAARVVPWFDYSVAGRALHEIVQN